MPRRSALLLSLLGLLLAACGTPPPSRIDWRHPGITQQYPLKPGTQWVAFSDSWKHMAEYGFADATRAVDRMSRGRAQGSWAVALDLDQTVIDNIEYHLMQDRKGRDFTPETWRDWSEARQARLVPGAQAFLRHVKAKGGYVIFVSNRRSYQEEATRDNLAALGLEAGRDYDILLLQAWPDGVSEKDARYDEAAATLSQRAGRPVAILVYVGDQSTDKPKQLGRAHFSCIPQGNLYGKPCEFTSPLPRF